MGGGTTTSTTKQEEDPQIVSRKLDAYDTAKARSENLMAPFSGQRVAGFDPQQLSAQQGLLNIAQTQPGSDSLAQSKGIFSNLGAYKPGLITPQTYTPKTIKDVNIGDYMNPYEDQVVSRFLQDNERARQIQGVTDNQKATAAHAFGGSRHGVADSLTNEAFGRTAATTLAGLRQGGYDRAMTAASGDVDRMNQGGIFNVTNDYNAQAGNISNDMAGAQFRQGIARELSGLSEAELQRALSFSGIQAAVGDSRQAMEQALLDAAAQAYEEQRMQPVMQQGILTSALSGLPTMMSSTTTQKQSGGFGSILSPLLGIAGAASGLGWAPFAAGAVGGSAGLGRG